MLKKDKDGVKDLGQGQKHRKRQGQKLGQIQGQDISMANKSSRALSNAISREPKGGGKTKPTFVVAGLSFVSFLEVSVS
jgi:hypothetical protein